MSNYSEMDGVALLVKAFETRDELAYMAGELDSRLDELRKADAYNPSELASLMGTRAKVWDSWYSYSDLIFDKRFAK